MVIIHPNKLEESVLLKMGVRICPSFWYQMALFRVLAHGLIYSEEGKLLILLHIERKAQKSERYKPSMMQNYSHLGKKKQDENVALPCIPSCKPR